MIGKRGSRRLSRAGNAQPRTYPQASISDAIESLLVRFDQRIVAKRLAVEVDVDVSTPELDQGQALTDAFEKLLYLVIERCPFGGELLITALETEAGLEIEFADSGEGIPISLQHSHLTAFRPTEVEESTLNLWRRTTQQPPKLNCQVYCARCPQGGLAWTLVQRLPEVALRVA